MQSHEEFEELVAAYSLSALGAEERAALEQHLAACDRCAGRLAEMRALASALPLAADELEPPSGLKERVLAAVSAEASGQAAATSAEVAAPTGNAAGTGIGVAVPYRRPGALLRTSYRWLALAAAMVVLVATVAGLAFWVIRLQDTLAVRELRVNRGYTAITIMAQAEQWWRSQGTEVAPTASGVVAYSSQDGMGCLVALGLPPAEGSRYYAWTIQDGKPAGLGPMWNLGNGLWIIIPGDVTRLDAVAITLEDRRTPDAPSGLLVARIPISSPR